MQKARSQQIELRPWQIAIIFALSCFILILRRPDAVLHAQFWAEDGHVWFADAYNFGWWRALFRAQDGYFQILPRLAASLALLVPLRHAPLIMNVIAILIEALPVPLLLSSRLSQWGGLKFRALLAMTYLFLPNSREVGAILTNSQWILALCAFLVLASVPARSVGAQIFDALVLLLCGLTGPFCAFLLPVALILAYKSRDRKQFGSVLLIAACCAIQAWGLLVVNPSGRTHYAHVLGASPGLLARLLAGHIYLGTLLGGNLLATSESSAVSALLACIAVLGTVILLFCFRELPIEMKLFLIFSGALLAVSLGSPNTGSQPGMPGWEFLSRGTGIRYWFFPTLAFAWSLLWGMKSERTALKTISIVLGCVMCFGVIRDFRHRAFADTHFAASARDFELAPPGSMVMIPENPLGWTVQLVKH